MAKKENYKWLTIKIGNEKIYYGVKCRNNKPIMYGKPIILTEKEIKRLRGKNG
jgi:hypothetical protein